MGGGDSKEEHLIYNTKYIYYDKTGNLREGGPERDRDDEMRKIMMTDSEDDQVGVN